MAAKDLPTDGSSTATSTSASPTALEVDTTYYTWSTFFDILLNRSTPEAHTGYFNARDTLNEARDSARVTSQVAALYKSSPIIRFLRSEAQNLGHDIPQEKIYCKRCTTAQSGGFDQDYGILLCSNYMRDKGHVEDTLAHEMVHAYDHLRFNIERFNLRHQACTEIRASTLSGECRFVREFFTRNQYKVTQQLQECVRRRATLSVAMRPNCKDDVQAAQVVNEVWDSCFSDTRPFDQIFR